MALVATFIDVDTFTVVNDYTLNFTVGRKLRLYHAGGIAAYRYGYVSASSFGAGVTTVDVDQIVDPSGNDVTLTADLSTVEWSVVNATATGNQFVPYEIDTERYASFSEAIDSIGADNRTLAISSAYAASVNKVVPDNVTLKFYRSGSLVVANGVTVTINGDIDAGKYQVFSGLGTVQFTNTGNLVPSHISAEWFGADPTGGSDSTTAIANAISAAGTGGVVTFGPGLFLSDNITVTGPNRVSLVGTLSGVWHHVGGAVNDLYDATVLQCNSGEVGTFLNITAPDTGANSQGRICVKNFTLLGCSTSSIVLSIQYNTQGSLFQNLWIGVHEDATACDGVQVLASWRIKLLNVYIWHGSEGGRFGAVSTGKGLYIHNNTTYAGAINQCTFEQVHARYFGRGIQVGETNVVEVKSSNINGNVFIGGASEFSIDYGMWLGTGIEGLTFLGSHVENTGTIWNGVDAYDAFTDGAVGVYMALDGTGIGFDGIKFRRNSGEYGSTTTSKEIHIDRWGTEENKPLSGISFRNCHFDEVGNYGFYIEGGEVIENIILENLTLLPRTDARGIGLWADNTAYVHGLIMRNVNFSWKGITFASDVVGSGNVKEPVDFIISTNINHDDVSPVFVARVRDGDVVKDVWVEITEIFDGDTTVNIGDGASANGFVPTASITLGTLGYYPTNRSNLGAYLFGANDLDKIYTAFDTVDATIATTTGTQGAATVYTHITKLKRVRGA